MGRSAGQNPEMYPKMELVTRGGFKPPSCANCKLHIDLFFTIAFMRSNCKEQVWIVEHEERIELVSNHHSEESKLSGATTVADAGSIKVLSYRVGRAEGGIEPLSC